MVEDEQGDFFTAWLGTEGAGTLLDNQPRELGLHDAGWSFRLSCRGAANETGRNHNQSQAVTAI
jgi:hypothetical protein